MNTFNDNLDSADGASSIDKWVLESCFLDLLVDEEEPEDLENWSGDRRWSSMFLKARQKIESCRRGDKDIYSLLTESRLKSELNSSEGMAEWFLKMKAARAKETLDCNKKRRDYAESQSHDENGRESVRKAIEAVNNTLDAINLDCLVGFGLINRDPQLVGQEEWRVLAALFHSEACASGTTADVSYGLARAFEKLFLKDHRWTWLFRLISTNNQGRGFNHQRNYAECIRLLVPLLEDFDFNVEETKYLPLAVRLVFFPRVFILAESLKECHRKAEAAWWLEHARDEREVSNYWRSRLNLELSSLGNEKQDPNIDTQPKLMNQKQELEYLEIERQISEGQEIVNLDNFTLKWAESLAWTIRWHEEDLFNLLGTIQCAAQSVQTVSVKLKELFRKPAKEREKQSEIYKKCLDNLSNVLNNLRQAIGRSMKDTVFKFLSFEDELSDTPLTLRQGISAWKPLKCLMSALKSMIKFPEELIARPELKEKLVQCKSDFEPWLNILIERLTKARDKRFTDGARFAEVASDQKIYDLLQNPEELCGPNSKRIRKEGCKNDPNCAEKTLRLGGSSGKFRVTSTEYLLTRMSRFEAEFTRFLKGPSLQLGYDPIKKQDHPVTPLTEFISLKRWSSFSPNLASHGTTTVGGGYLVRVWDKSSKTYFGIAIDPGYNYLENLFDEAFTLPDVHVIAITHAHPDHVENLSNILTLLREREKRIKTTSWVFLVLTEGVFQRFKTLIDNEIDYIHDVVVLSWDRPERDTVNVVRGGGKKSNRGPISLTVSGSNDKPNPDKTEVPPLASIKAVRAIHADGTEFDSMGMVIRVVDQEGNGELKIGFTGDTRYSSSLSVDEFANCKVLVPHLGSVIRSEAFSNSHEFCSPDHEENIKRALKELQPTLTEKNHLYLPGISMLMCELDKHFKKSQAALSKKIKRPLIILSEFGEELRGGLRVDLASRLQRVFKMTVLPADVGLRVGVNDQSVRCAICRQYVNAAAVRPVAVSDEDEALLFVCKDCCRARQHELPMLLNRLRNTPHELHLLPTGETLGSRGSEDGIERPEADLHPPKQS